MIARRSTIGPPADDFSELGSRTADKEISRDERTSLSLTPDTNQPLSVAMFTSSQLSPVILLVLP